MLFDLDFLPGNVTDEDIFAEVRRVDALIGEATLTRRAYDKIAKIHSSTLIKRYGDWATVLLRAEIAHKYSGRSATDKMRLHGGHRLTDDEILDELRRVANLLSQESITRVDLRNHSAAISEAVVASRFGSWMEGVRCAGLQVSNNYRAKLTDEDYFENLLTVWVFHGRQPLWREMDDPPSAISPSAYQKHFGGWRRALETFVARTRQDDPQAIASESAPKTDALGSIAIVPVKVTQTQQTVNTRSVSMGLRFRVLDRDRFKCTKCGSSPASDLNCKLHVDHVIPYSRGGKTIQENLQTLCEICNLGKGNRHFE